MDGFPDLDASVLESHDTIVKTIGERLVEPVMNVMPKGLVWLVPSSLGFCGQGRSAKNSNGNLTSPTVIKAMHHSGVLTLVALICWLNDVRFIIEQPSQSWLAKSDPLALLLNYIGCHKFVVHTCTGSFGAEPSVQIKLWGTWAAASTLGRSTCWGSRSSLTWDRTESYGVSVEQVIIMMRKVVPSAVVVHVILCSRIVLSGSKSANRAGFWPVCFRAWSEMGPPAAD